MKIRWLAMAIIISLASVAVFVHYGVSQTPKPWRGFAFTNVPTEVSGYPGQDLTIQGGVLNTGWYWLGDFNITLSGMPNDYQYSVTPSHFDNIMIVREWNPTDGVYRVPQNFTVDIKVPDNASGVYLINMTGQEFRSWYKYSNSTQFLLKITSLPEFKITSLIFPEKITENQPFNLTFTVENNGVGSGTLNLKIDAPQDWSVSDRTESITLNAGASQPVQITVIPTNTSGNLNVLAEYPYKDTVINITQYGPFLTPSPVQLPSPESPIPTGLGVLANLFKGVGPIVFAIGVILLIIIVWNVWSIYKGYKSKKEPEEMKAKKSSVSNPGASSVPEL